MADLIRQRIRLIHLCCAAGVLLTVASAGALVVLPMFRSGTESIKDAGKLRGDLKQLDGLSLKLQEVKSRISTIEGEIEKEEKRLPTRNQMDQFMEELSSVATGAGVNFEASSKAEVESVGDYKAMTAQITASGSYAQCYKFLAGLRRMERLTQLKDCTIDAEQKVGEGSKPGEKGDCRLKISIATFMAK
jgi:Tfp pilus assembly protein PilO